VIFNLPQPNTSKAHSQTAKRRARGFFKRSRGTLVCQSTRYFHQDHLGSIAVITDEAGVVVERLAYDPWGKRRNANGNTDPTDSLVGLSTDRGYTEHEHLDEVGVIHMNGRVFDPLIGRFMSVDPFIQAPFELQSHNRYAYVMNNPLAFTDPSGYTCSFGIGGSLSDCVSDAGSSISRVWQRDIYGSEIGQIALTASAAYFGGVWGAVGYASGSTYDRTGSFESAAKAGLIAWATAKGFTWAKGTGDYIYAAHGLVGCVSTVASGGKCGAGAAAAMFGKYATNNWIGETAEGKWDTGQFVATITAGGVGSVLGGGKFENGAKTAAYGYIFNWGAGKYKDQRLSMADRAAGITQTDKSLSESTNTGLAVMAVMPVTMAPLMREPIGGSINSQIEYGLLMDEINMKATVQVATRPLGLAGTAYRWLLDKIFSVPPSPAKLPDWSQRNCTLDKKC
jgi:RHS repeat-associated protein